MKTHWGKLMVIGAWLLLLAPATFAQTYSLGTTNLFEGPMAGSDSVVLGATNSWTATANDSWLYLSAANQSGTGNTNVIFTFDANSGAPRTGTLTIAGQTVTVTQAGSTYVAITNTTTLVSSGLNNPTGVAVDGAGNVYIADKQNSAIKKWTATNNTVTTLVSSGLNQPNGVAVDGAGNVYIADSVNTAIKKWTAANSNVTTLVSSGLSNPYGVAVDVAGNVYIADLGNNTIKKWTAANSNITTLVSSGLNQPIGVAVDGTGNVYIADTSYNKIKKWTAANSNVTILVSSALIMPTGVAVDGAGNVYFVDNGNNAVKKWIAASNTVTTLASKLNSPFGVASDSSGNVYLADTGTNMIKELPRAFVDTTAKIELAMSGNDTLPVVVPATANLSGPFAPTSDQSWLTIAGVTNGVVSFAFTTVINSPKANINLLGQNIPIYRKAAIGTTNLLVGPAAGSDSVAIAAIIPWTATANDIWLHLSAANQSNTVSANVIFTFDANPGVTRTGTLTIDGQVVIITQAGSAYVPITNATALVFSNSITSLNQSSGVAVDSAGNVYIADTFNNAIKKWTVANNTVTTLVSSGLSAPSGVAVDGAGNVYIADTLNNAIKKWTVTNNVVTTLVSSGLSAPSGVAVDGAGNVYIADTFNNALKKWTAANSNITTLVSSGLNYPSSVAVDGAGNVYIADTFNNAIKKWTAANSSVTTVVSGLSSPYGVALDGSGNFYIADNGSKAIKKWIAASNTLTTLVSSGLSSPRGVAVDGAGNVYLADSGTGMIKELPHAFVDPTGKLEVAPSGNDSLPVVVPAAVNLSGPFTPTSDQPWLTISGVTNGVVSFAFTPSFMSPLAQINLLGQKIPIYRKAVIGTTNLLEGPGAGSDSVAISAILPWTATTNDTWLHLSAANQNGTVSTNLVFTFDANPGATRTGTLTIDGQTVTITQAGSTYVSVNYPANIVSSGLSKPCGVAVDGAGNVYIADTNNNAIKKWTAADSTVTTLVSSGLSGPSGVAVDGAGNVYIADTFNNAIKKWTAANSNVSTLVSSGVSSPRGVAVDGAGNVYIADNAIKKWTAANSNLTTLVSSGLTAPYGVAVDVAGNVYIADYMGILIKKWMAANGAVINLGSPIFSKPTGVAVDGGGNVYVIDAGMMTGFGSIQKWSPTNGVWNTLVSGLSSPSGVAVDGAGNFFVADKNNNTIKEWPRAFVDAAPKVVGGQAGSATLPVAVVLPASARLTGPFLPTSDSAWLTITGVTNGVVSFAFTANSSANRMANIVVLGKNIAVTQLGTPGYFSLNNTNLVEGPAAGSESVLLVANSSWTASANNAWLHLSAANQSGTGNTNVIFTFDANSGAPRTGTLTIGGQIVTVIQAGSTYVPVTNVTTLVSSGLTSSSGVAVDGEGNVYIADYGNNAIKKWTAANNTFTTVVSSGLSSPRGVAVDGAGNVYIADSGNHAVKKWIAASSTVITLASVSFMGPFGVAVDGAGNVYYSDGANLAIMKWTAANSNTTTVVSGLIIPHGVVVDGAGNIYLTDSGDGTLKKWAAVNGVVTTLLSPGLYAPSGVAVDGAGNVYFASSDNNTLKKWTAANGNVITVVSLGLTSPSGLAVDGAGNVYIGDRANNEIKALPHAFVDSTTKVEGALAGSDALPVVVPATAKLTGPFLPTSDSPWLTITGVTNGVVSYAFAANYTTNRTANITLLGQPIAVTQPAVLPPVLNNCTILGNGSLRFSFTNNQGATFSVWSATNMMLPFTNWTMLAALTNNGSGQYNFTNPPGDSSQRFYRVTAP